jgi:hypothetical protein
MAAAIHVRISSLTLPASADRDELGRRVEQELCALLEREPLRADPPAELRAGGRIHAAHESTVAHAVARLIHTALQTGG